MPYVITTTHTVKRREAFTGDEPPVPTRRAVPTLDEARRHAAKAIIDSAFHRGSTEGYPGDPRQMADEAIAEVGGSVGPLPDGTVIEAWPARWDELLEVALVASCGPIERYPGDGGQPVIDAFNAAQGQRP